jgi:hypothetical protein
MAIEIEIEEGLGVDVDIDDVNADPPLEWDDDDRNLVATFSMSEKGQEELKRISTKMKDAFDNEWEAQTERRERSAADWKIFIGNLEKKTFPFENCANINVPIAYENIIRLAFRMSGELFGDWTNVIGVLPTGPEDMDASALLSKHANWQFEHQITDFPRQMDKAILKFLLDGDVTCHSFYDSATRKNRHEILGPDEFIVPNGIMSSKPDYADSPFVCRVLTYTRQQVYKMKGIWFGVDELLENELGSDEDEIDSPMKQATADVQGTEQPDAPTYPTYKILLWVGWMDMPGYERPRYVQGYIHNETGKLLQLTIHERTPWEEVERYLEQERELEAFRENKKLYNEAANLAIQSQDAMMANPMVDDIDKMSSSMEGGGLPPPPVKPKWMKDEDDDEERPPEIRKEPELQFTHGVLIEPLDGTIGFGFGQLVADLNKAANTVIDQYVDAATVSNVSEIIATADVKFAKNFRSRPGAMHKVENISGDDLHKSIMVLPKGAANPQMIQLIELLIKWGQSAPQSPDILSGAPGKSGETRGGITIRSEHAIKQLSVITRKFSRFVALIYKKNAELNSIFMDEAEFVAVNNKELGAMEMLEVGRDLYRRQYDVTFRSDMMYSSASQKIQEADELVNMAMTIPYLQSNPLFVKTAIIKALKAREEHDMAKIIEESPDPMPPQEEGGEVPSGVPV